MTPERGKKAKIQKRGLGFNQMHVLQILEDISARKNLQDVSYYGGSIAKGQRCISIGRECRLMYNIPWEVIDLRHAGKIFWISEQQRLGFNTQKTFNRAVHSLVQRGFLMPVHYDEVLPKGGEKVFNPYTRAGRLRFVKLNAHYA